MSVSPNVPKRGDRELNKARHSLISVAVSLSLYTFSLSSSTGNSSSQLPIQEGQPRLEVQLKIYEAFATKDPGENFAKPRNQS